MGLLNRQHEKGRKTVMELIMSQSCVFSMLLAVKTKRVRPFFSATSRWSIFFLDYIDGVSIFLLKKSGKLFVYGTIFVIFLNFIHGLKFPLKTRNVGEKMVWPLHSL